MLEEDNIFRVHEEQTTSLTSLMIINPGSAYLRCLQYYSEEKEISLQNGPSKLLLWEKFVSKYFAANIEMTVTVLEQDNLFYELSNPF